MFLNLFFFFFLCGVKILMFMVHNKKILIMLSCCAALFFAKNTFAQSSYTISGSVIDDTTGETLLGASVILKEINKGTISNEYGFYSVTVPQGKYTLLVSYMGYRTFEKAIDLSSSQKINISLQPDSSELKEVVVKSNVMQSRSQVQNVLSGVNTIKKADIKKIPALLGEPDIVRTVLTMPGVTTIGEGTSGFNVRGGNIDQNLILMDEAPIYNSSHVFGFFSVFNPDAVKNIKLYKGGIPPRFGGRASSVLDIRQTEGSLRKFKAEGGVGMLFSRLTLQGPIAKDKLSYMFSGRRSYFDIFFALSSNDAVKNSSVYFYDLSTKLTWKINDKNTLYFSGYFGADVFNQKMTNSDDKDKEDEDGVNKTTSTTSNFIWNNRTATLRWNHIFSDKLFMNLSSIYSRYNYGISVSSDGGTASGGPGGENRGAGDFNWESKIDNYIIRPDFTLFLENDTKFRFGMDNTLYQFSPAKITGSEQSSLDFKTESLLTLAPYLSYNRKWSKLSLNAGVRYSWTANIGPYEVAEYGQGVPKNSSTIKEEVAYKSGEIIKQYSGFEPRLALNYSLNEISSLKLSYNRVFQYLGLISNTAATIPLDIWRPVGKHIKPLEVNQVALGYARDFQDQMYNFTAEVYYKTFKNIIEYKDGADLFLNKNIEKELLHADGYSTGLELAFYKSSGKLQGNINYTFSVTRRKTTSPYPSENLNRGEYYPSNFDRPHVLNLTLMYPFNKKWEASAFFTYQTGRPITEPTSKYTQYSNSGLERTYLVFDDRNASRLPDTHRLDLGLTYNFVSGVRWRSSLSFGVYNSYGNKNAFSRETVLRRSGTIETNQYSVVGVPIPYVNYNFKF